MKDVCADSFEKGQWERLLVAAAGSLAILL